MVTLTQLQANLIMTAAYPSRSFSLMLARPAISFCQAKLPIKKTSDKQLADDRRARLDGLQISALCSLNQLAARERLRRELAADRLGFGSRQVCVRPFCRDECAEAQQHDSRSRAGLRVHRRVVAPLFMQDRLWLS